MQDAQRVLIKIFFKKQPKAKKKKQKQKQNKSKKIN